MNFHPTPPPYQHDGDHSHDWSTDDWVYVNGGVGALLLIIVLTCVFCCIADSIPYPGAYFYRAYPQHQGSLPYRIDEEDMPHHSLIISRISPNE